MRIYQNISETRIFTWFTLHSVMRNYAGNLIVLFTCNEKVEGSIPFTGTNQIKRLGYS